MSSGSRTAIRMTLTGRVQGLGVRPAIARWATQLSLTGWVGNTCQGVEVVVEGPPDSIDRFTRELRQYLPGAAAVERQECVSIEPPGSETFAIRRDSASGALAVRVPQDLVTCEDCRDEALRDDGRRSGYAFTSCTACGPRYSIVESMPYERAHTTMRLFELCPACQREYDSAEDRRYHSETNACPECGPRWWCRDRSGRIIATHKDAIRVAAEAIQRGEIVALQGLGGYQLLVDATSEAAVSRLRHRKRRYGKPLTILVASLDDARRYAHGDDVECDALRSPAGPIVVLVRKDAPEMARGIAPGLDTLGVMLPTTLLHALLARACRRPLVVTSGNREGEPLEFEHDGAHNRLADIADLWLEHDRVIQRPIDDSVVRVIAGRVAVLRLARGFAPLPLNISSPTPLLAVGGQQKAAIALSNGAQAVLGPHIGDLNSVAERERWERQLAELRGLYGSPQSILVGDPHPAYASTRWAIERQQQFVPVQHHHAHVVAGMVEHGWLDRTVLGVAFDGTGAGDDGTVWGGEFLLATVAGFRRVGHLLPFDLPGGERAIREPWRVAVALVQRAAGNGCASSLAFHTGDSRSLIPLIGSTQFSPTTTSAGRLFDGIAALVLGVERSQFEGEGPMLLEAICDRSDVRCYPIPVSETDPIVLDWRPAVVQTLDDIRAGVAPGVIAMRFHRGLARAVFEATRRFPQLPIVLSGGCFQNRVLVELIVELCGPTGHLVATPGLIPVNDGGLAAGQLAIAAGGLLNRTGA